MNLYKHELRTEHWSVVKGVAAITVGDETKEEIKERIKNNTITEILNRIDVKLGDVVIVKAGTIHAIGAGILIAEIQQNLNCTYRMYDYDKRERNKYA